jgi:hypothetical protein
MKLIITTISFLNFLIIALLPAMEEPTKISRREFQRAILSNDAYTVNEYLEKEKPDPKKLVRSLHAALDREAVGSVALLLRYGTPVNEPYHKNGPTPLFKMTQKGNLLLVEWLRIFKGNSKLPNKDGITPIDIANDKIAEALKQKDQEAALHYNEIFNMLSMPYALMQMRQYQVQVPEELWNQSKAIREQQ